MESLHHPQGVVMGAVRSVLRRRVVDDAFFAAVKRKDVNGVRLLIAAGADVNRRHLNDMTGLMLASKKGHVSCVRLLLEAGAHVNVSGGMDRMFVIGPFDKMEKTPLIFAAENGHCECEKTLIEAGADVNESDYFEDSALMYASKMKDNNCAHILIKSGADVNSVNCGDETALFYAVENQNPETLKNLIEKGADVNKIDYDGNTALMHTAKIQDNTCAAILVNAEADVNVVNDMGKTALFIAVENDNAETLKCLIDGGADINKTDSDNNSMLMLAVGRDNSACAEYLIEAGADVNCRNEKGDTALFVAVQNKNVQILDSLITAGADVNMTNSEGITAIKQATVDNDDKCLGILIRARNQGGQPKTPLPGLFDLLLDPNHLVNIRCVKLLMAAGAKINENGVDDNFLLEYSLRSDICPMCKVDPTIYRLMAAAGEVDTTSDYVGKPASNFPWLFFNMISDLSLKHLCREAIRKHLLELDPHSHLFGRVPKLGLPTLLNEYLLYDVTFENDDENCSDCEEEEEEEEFITSWVTPVLQNSDTDSDEELQEEEGEGQLVPTFLLKDDLYVRHLCRETIRKHLLKLNRYTHLFGRLLRLGLPFLLTEYLLYDVALKCNLQ